MLEVSAQDRELTGERLGHGLIQQLFQRVELVHVEQQTAEAQACQLLERDIWCGLGHPLQVVARGRFLAASIGQPGQFQRCKAGIRGASEFADQALAVVDRLVLLPGPDRLTHGVENHRRRLALVALVALPTLPAADDRKPEHDTADHRFAIFLPPSLDRFDLFFVGLVGTHLSVLRI